MEITPESIHNQIPYYLSDTEKVSLADAFNDFPNNAEYYLDANVPDVDTLQGDGWTSLQIVDFGSLEQRSIKGIILSNTCDISPENTRGIPARLSFAPIVKLSKYVSLLKASGLQSTAIENKLQSIKAQGITSIFYLPACENLEEDYIALLDDLHSMPAKAFFEMGERKKFFTLSQFGFYIFVFKLSVHFCRFHEGVHRTA